MLASQAANAQTGEDGPAAKLATPNAEADDENNGNREKTKELGAQTLLAT